MSASWLMVLASFLFATMGVCVKLASAHFAAGEIMFYRGLTGALLMWGLWRARGISLRTRCPGNHFWRSLTGVTAMYLWFYALGNLPLATAMTLNYMSSIWMAFFLIGGAAMLGTTQVDPRLVGSVLMGFCGVALILHPTIAHDQLWHGLIGLLSGVISATAYLQVAALARSGEPEIRIVFYFSLGGAAFGLVSTGFTGRHALDPSSAAQMLAIGGLASVAQLMMTRAYSTGRALVNASLQYLGIAFSFAYGVTLFADAVTWSAVAGMALIVAAGWWASLLRSQSALPDTASVPLES
jgi:S-adenosylmethionine uptake transporter